MESKLNNKPQCCKKAGNKNDKKKGMLMGAIYGLIPHAGCLAFILFSVIGLTAFASVFKPLLSNSYLFYAMIMLSFVFATFSAYFYLNKHGGVKEAKNHKGYLATLYGTTIIVAALLYFIIFPLTISFASAQDASNLSDSGYNSLKVAVSIPCSGHAPLIIDEVKKIEGVKSVTFEMPNIFEIKYNSSITSKDKILGAAIFNDFPAKEI
jgi:heme/copper-type cytochrome/quinol oxidase subunit 4